MGGRGACIDAAAAPESSKSPLFEPVTVAVREAGVLALRCCEEKTAGHVAAVFARSAYVQAGDVFLCVGESTIGRGPLTLILDATPAMPGLRVGAPVKLARHAIVIGAAVFDLDGCAVYRAPDWPTVPPVSQLRDVCIAVTRRAIPQPDAPGSGVVAARKLAEGVEALRGWLAAAPCTAAPPVRALLGLGSGLTPSGDDVLCGALAALDALGQRDLHGQLADAVAAAACALTSPLSAGLLRAVCEGHVGERLHAMVVAMLAGDAGAAVAIADGIGHGSGRDTLTGIATAFVAAPA